MSAPAAPVPSPFGRTLLTIASAMVILAGLRAASPVVGPVIIALLLTVAWSPASAALRRRGWNSTVAALTGIVIGIVLIGLAVLLVWSSLSQLLERLPEYQPRVEELRQAIARLLQRLPFDTSLVLRAEALQPGAVVGYAVTTIRGLTSTAGALGVLVLVMAFMMIEGMRYPAKLRLAARDPEATERLDRFGQGLRDYVVINTVFGLVAGALNTVLLLALGVDFAILWGVASFALSFLPNIGFLVALVPPALLALIQFGFGRAIAVTAGFIVINFVVDNVIKPRFVGKSLDLSPVVVLLSLLFWGWMLGVSGALLAVPLTMALKFLCEGFDETRWLAVLLSDADPGREQAVDPDAPPIAG
jgi:AI-2 transport protein TqsA